MPEAIRAAIARVEATTPKMARTFAAMSQQHFADWFGLSVSTVNRAEQDGTWERWPKAALMVLVLWLSVFGPDPEQGFRAVGRWATFKDVENAGDALHVRLVEGQPLLEAMTASSQNRQAS